MSDLILWGQPWSGRLLVAVMCLAGLACLYRALFADRSRGCPRCPRCWYNMTGASSSACPECGFEAGSTAEHHRTRRHWRLAIIGLLIATSLPAYTAHRRISMYGWDYYLRLQPLYTFFPHRLIKTYQEGDFTIDVYRDRRGQYSPELARIRHRGRLLLEETCEWRFAIESPFVYQNATGNGRPNIVLHDWSGGAHCCFTMYIYEMEGTTLRLIGKVDGAHGKPGFEDVDGNGRMEVVLHDWTFAYWWASFADSPAVEVILRFEDGAYRFAEDLMRKPPPSRDSLSKRAQYVRAYDPHGYGNWPHSMLWSEMLGLIVPSYW